MKKTFTLLTLVILFVGNTLLQNASAQPLSKALSFEGGYLDPNFNTYLNTFTIECWVKGDAAPDGSNYAYVLGKDANFDICWNHASIPDFQGAFSYLGNDDQWYNATFGPLSGGVWYHLCATYDGSDLKAYKNGILITTTAAPSPKNNGASEYALIGSHPVNSNRFAGKIDEVRFWNIARTQAQIQANMNKELVGDESGLVLYYKMSNGSGASVTDNKNGGTHTGTLHGSEGSDFAWINSGAALAPNQSLTFDGTNYVDVPYNSALIPSNALTISAWINASSWASNYWLGTIVGIDNWTSDPIESGWVLRCGDNGILSFVVAGNDNIWHESVTGPTMSSGTWYHVTGVFDGSTIKTYINGIETSSTSVGSLTIQQYTLNGMFIGKSPNEWEANRVFYGSIDEVQVWNAALTEAQIRENMMKSLKGNEANLVAYYRFDEGEGSTAYDLTLNAFDGSLVNTPTYSVSTPYNTWIGDEGNASYTNDANWTSTVKPVVTDNVGLYSWNLGNAPSISGNPTLNTLLISNSFSGSLGSQFTTNGNLLVNGSATLFGGNNLTQIDGYLGVSSGGTINVPADGQLTTNGNILNNGTMNLKANSSSSASLLDNGTLNGSGIYNFQQDITGANNLGTPSGRMYYISSPVVSATSNVFDAAGVNKLWSYDESANGYTEITDNATVLNPMQGYVVRVGASETVTFTGGALNTGNLSNSSLTRTGTSNSTRGYSLIGNPYPSYLDWDAATKTNIESTMWYRTFNGTDMVFDTYNSSGDIGTNNNLAGAVTQYIPPCQSFWVRVDADNNTGQLAFDNSMRSHQTGHLRSTNSTSDILRLSASNSVSKDEAIIIFNPSATNGFDNYDSEKMFANAAQVPQIFTLAGSEKAVINTMTDIPSNIEVPLGFKTDTAGTFSITATDISGFTSYPIILEDLLLGTTQDLKLNPTYTFSSTKVDNMSRFKIVFATTTNVKELQNESINVFSSYKQINIMLYGSPGIENNVFVYDLLGREVKHETMNNNQVVIDVAVAGTYIVKVQSDKNVYIKKVVVK